MQQKRMGLEDIPPSISTYHVIEGVEWKGYVQLLGIHCRQIPVATNGLPSAPHFPFWDDRQLSRTGKGADGVQAR